MARHLFIVSREHARLYEYLVNRFEDDGNVRVLIDRRVGDRRVERAGRDEDERRAGDRRQLVPDHDDLRFRSHRIVTLGDDGDEEIRTPRAP